jgi:hypothetical protein
MMSNPGTPPLPELIRAYNQQCEHQADGYVLGDRRTDRPELARALSRERLTSKSEDELARLANDLRQMGTIQYGSPGPQSSFYGELNTPASRARIARTLHYLLYGRGRQEHITDRLHQCISRKGDYKVKGIAEAIAVKALAIMQPERWIPCYMVSGVPDRKTGKLKDKKTVLRILGMDLPPTRRTADLAATTNDLIRDTLRAAGIEDEPWRMEDFAWWLTETYQPHSN